MKKACYRCGVMKEYSCFHRDAGNSDGFSSSCAQCRNASRRMRDKIRRENKSTMPRVATETALENVRPAKVIIEREEDSVASQVKLQKIADPLLHILQKISRKHDAHLHMSIDKSERCRLQIHSNPNMIYKADNLSHLLSILALEVT